MAYTSSGRVPQIGERFFAIKEHWVYVNEAIERIDREEFHQRYGMTESDYLHYQSFSNNTIDRF